MEPLPCPLLSDVMTTHGDVLDADQVQSLVVVTAIVPAPPVGGTALIEFSVATWHFAAEGPLTDTEDDPHADARRPRRTTSGRVRMGKREQSMRDRHARAITLPSRAAPC
jgi:hypothetical protein